MFPQVQMCESCLKQGKLVAVDPARVKAGFGTCLPCGEKAARQVRHTVVPLPKSNYVVVSDMTLLRGLNSSHKGGR